MIPRETFLSLIHGARVAGRLDFAKAVAAEWLAAWPGDMEIRLYLARAEFEAGASRAAIEHLHQLLRFDPESVDAYDLLGKAYRESSDPMRAPVYQACAEVLRDEAPDLSASPSWSAALYRALQALERGEPAQATLAAQDAMAADPSLPLPALVAIRAALAASDVEGSVSLAKVAHDRWPECLIFRLVLAESMLAGGDHSRGVEILHRIVADDPLGIVSTGFLGENHRYRDLWPSVLEAKLNQPAPAEVLATLEGGILVGKTIPVEAESSEPVDPGALADRVAPKTEGSSDESVDNLPAPEPWEAFQGPDGSDDTDPEDPDQLLDIRREFDQLAARLNARTSSDDFKGRVPAYIILSSHTRLVQAYGTGQFKAINQAVMSLVEAVRRRKGWVAYRVYVDDPQSMQPFDLSPCDPGNAWQIKLRLADLDKALAQRGEMIGAVLLVGGHRIVPFHLLPNPTDDDDDHVPSDNPYATTDENYFAPEWPVGRLPADQDPDLLIKMLLSAVTLHRESTLTKRMAKRISTWVRNRFSHILRTQAGAVGYSASIWRKASLAVFRTIGAPRSLVTSPPAAVGSIPGSITRPSKFSYFNLHGLEDEPEWFGQRDPLRDKTSSTEFPVALRPEDIVNGGRAPKVVFTEACYGANSIDKGVDEALSIKFLASGSHAVVGSTKISYGSVSPPLIAADLIGRFFWQELESPVPVGEALRRAKLRLATEMHDRQGYLDGEDQKTLISFVLYGDPLYAPQTKRLAPAAKWVSRPVQRPKQLKTACALGGPDLIHAGTDPDAIARVRSIVAQYLPGMSDAECHLRSQHAGCQEGDHQCPSQQVGVKTHGGTHENQTMVVTFAKHLDEAARRHPRYARVTLDKAGKVLKLAVSR